jgi:hypothetical protein
MYIGRDGFQSPFLCKYESEFKKILLITEWQELSGLFWFVQEALVGRHLAGKQTLCR